MPQRLERIARALSLCLNTAFFVSFELLYAYEMDEFSYSLSLVKIVSELVLSLDLL